MRRWHTCETTHCVGGWVVTLAGKAGAELEMLFGMPQAPALILRASGAPLPSWYATDDQAMAWIRHQAAREVETA
jgi:hypothetical protein